jgi:hypothetical protein
MLYIARTAAMACAAEGLSAVHHGVRLFLRWAGPGLIRADQFLNCCCKPREATGRERSPSAGDHRQPIRIASFRAVATATRCCCLAPALNAKTKTGRPARTARRGPARRDQNAASAPAILLGDWSVVSAGRSELSYARIQPEMAGHQALTLSSVSAMPRVPVSSAPRFEWKLTGNTTPTDPPGSSLNSRGTIRKPRPTLPPLQNSQAVASPSHRKPAHAAERRTPAFARVTGKEVVVKYIHKPWRARVKGRGLRLGPALPLLAPQPSALR